MSDNSLNPAESCSLCLCTAPNMVSNLFQATMRNTYRDSTEFAVGLLALFELASPRWDAFRSGMLFLPSGLAITTSLHHNHHTLFDTNDMRIPYSLTFFSPSSPLLQKSIKVAHFRIIAIDLVHRTNVTTFQD